MHGMIFSLLRSWCLTTILLVVPTGALAGDFFAVANPLPPIKFARDGKMQGIAGDVLLALMERSGIPMDPTRIEIMPLSKGLQRVKDTPGGIMLGLAYNEDRAPHYKWVGPVYESLLGIFTLKSSGIEITDPLAAKYYVVGSVRGSGAEKQAIKSGVPPLQLKRMERSSDLVTALANGEVDLAILPKSPAYYIMIQQGLNLDDFAMIYEYKRAPLFLAFNKATDDALIEKLQTELETLKRPSPNGESEYHKIVSYYFRPSL